MQEQFSVEPLIYGAIIGELLFSDTSLSFWGGVDPTTGQIVDHHHPLRGQSLKGRILAIPSGRGSCTGSGVILELLLSGNGPAALVFQYPELILTLGVLVTEALFRFSIPVVVLKGPSFSLLQRFKHVAIFGNALVAADAPVPLTAPVLREVPAVEAVVTSKRDQEMLNGSHGPAAQVAMEILVKFAKAQGVVELLDVTQAHVDACVYIGPGSLSFAQRLAAMNATFVVPTTLNSISLDYRRWNELGIPAEVAQPARALADAYMSMGAKMSFTCAPYLLDSAPTTGQQIGWAESNAVVFANSILGARTQKYPDFLDVCIALTGRAPRSGCHVESNRRPDFVINLPELDKLDDSVYPVAGYLIGQLAGPRIPFIYGLEHANPRTADLKAFSAAFATTASAPMFHMHGVTPESANMEPLTAALSQVKVTTGDLEECHRRLNTATDASVGLVSLGNPHFATEELADLAKYCLGRQKHPSVKVAVTTNRKVYEDAQQAGYLDTLFEFGVEVITDTCWCMLDEPVVPVGARNLMTNSAKYAHYAPGLVRRGVHFGSLAQCIDVACAGECKSVVPMWSKSLQPWAHPLNV